MRPPNSPVNGGVAASLLWRWSGAAEPEVRAAAHGGMWGVATGLWQRKGGCASGVLFIIPHRPRFALGVSPRERTRWQPQAHK